jgi:hypothetical protein
MNSYPEDLYDDGDYIVERRLSQLRKEMYSHVVMGIGFGVLLTVAITSSVVWYLG